MKRMLISAMIAMVLAGSADATRRCGAPTKISKNGKVIATCRNPIPKRLKGQRCNFSSCREHAITDCDCEWYEQEAKQRGMSR